MASKPAGPEIIGVLPSNWNAVQVFSLAKPTWLLGFGICPVSRPAERGDSRNRPGLPGALR